MSVEYSNNAAVTCPFWKRVVVVGNESLGLCGSETKDALPTEHDDLKKPNFCPWWRPQPQVAYEKPSIIRTYMGRIVMRVSSQEPGTVGIAELEAKWNVYVREFIEDDSRNLLT